MSHLKAQVPRTVGNYQEGKSYLISSHSYGKVIFGNLFTSLIVLKHGHEPQQATCQCISSYMSFAYTLVGYIVVHINFKSTSDDLAYFSNNMMKNVTQAAKAGLY